LVGSSSLRLFQTIDEGAMIWNRKLSKPVKIASFSHDASLVASTGAYDRLIKLWRRQSFGSDDTRFDFTYLPHPTAVTGIHWRRSHEHEQTLDNVLFSMCADSKVRIWAATDPHGLQVLQLWAEIDMQESIQPRQIDLANQSRDRYAFIVDSRDFASATQRAVEDGADRVGKDYHALEHILEIGRRSPEVCVVLDGNGHMSAWGVESVGCKVRKRTKLFNITHIENLKLSFSQDASGKESAVRFLNFCSGERGSAFTLLAHHFDGRIEWLQGRIDELLDPSPRQDRLHLEALWTGHDGPVKKIVRSVSGKALISRTNDNEGLVWKQKDDRSGMALARSSSLGCSKHIHRTWLLGEGDFVILLHHHSITLWDARLPVAHQAASCDFEVEGRPLCLVQLPEPAWGSRVIHLATITSGMKGIVWEVHLPPQSEQMDRSGLSSDTHMKEFCSFDLGREDNLAFVLPVDPAGSAMFTSKFLDVFAKDIAISYTNSGVLCTWTARLDLEKPSVDWLVTSKVETGVDAPFLASGSSIKKTAVIDSAKTGLTIWDNRSGEVEHDVQYGSLDVVQDLDWSSTPDEQSILAVGFPHKVVILSQMRYDYLTAGPAWAAIREVYIREVTPHPIGDSTWLGSGNLVIGAGNQLFTYDKDVTISDDVVRDLIIPEHLNHAWDIFHLVTFLNGPLPIFHPQFLAQCILAGKHAQVQKIIVGLHKALRFFAPGDELDTFLSLPVDDFYIEQEVWITILPIA
jgi:WD40 repeat protein